MDKISILHVFCIVKMGIFIWYPKEGCKIHDYKLFWREIKSGSEIETPDTIRFIKKTRRE